MKRAVINNNNKKEYLLSIIKVISQVWPCAIEHPGAIAAG